MANYTYRTGNTSTARYTQVEAPPGTQVCPQCGGLECLCRPRFFAGQLLTEQDLNRLDHYITAKSKLHNRHLHGWGVVCGLEVLCNPCDNLVKVTSGYALSPCGDDIVVCKDETVDVCKLIKACRDQERSQQVCEPPGTTSNDECEDEEEWLLTIRYDEQPTRGITALRNQGAEACCNKCNGGGSASCNCGSSATGQAKTVNYNTAPKRSPECEPSVICEGYRYEVYRAPSTDPKQTDLGAMADRFMVCAKPFLDFLNWGVTALQNYETKSMDELFVLCCTLKNALRDLIKNHATHNCTLMEKVECLVCPQPDPQQFPTQADYLAVFQSNLDEAIMIWVNGLWDCMCSMILPPCPDSEQDPRIVLASVTIRKKDCHVLRVCNWVVQRKFATTFPNLQYWFSWLPFVRYLRQYLEKLCCDLMPMFDRMFTIGENVPTHGTTGFKKSTIKFDAVIGPNLNVKRSRDFSTLVMQMISGQMQGLDARTLVLGNMGMNNEQGQPYMTDLQKENLLPFLMLNQLVRPALANAGPADTGSIIGPAGLFSSVLSGMRTEKAATSDMDALKAEMAELRETLKKQNDQINKLKRTSKGK